MCEAGSDKPTGPRFGGRPGLELQNSRESLLPNTFDASKRSSKTPKAAMFIVKFISFFALPSRRKLLIYSPRRFNTADESLSASALDSEITGSNNLMIFYGHKAERKKVRSKATTRRRLSTQRAKTECQITFAMIEWRQGATRKRANCETKSNKKILNFVAFSLPFNFLLK